MLTMGTALSQQVDANWQTYIMIAVYFLILIVIGFYGYKQATGNLSEYMLGGRSIGPYITALSAGASDMSGWMIMGLPGSVYSTGLSAMWITIGLTLGAFIVIFYTFFGGYLAVSITDFFQGVIMLIAMVMVPIVAMMNLNGWGTFHDVAAMKPTNLNLFKGLSFIGIISLFSWGLGYFGQPHIIVRFMSIKSHKMLPKARRLGISWMAVGLLGAVAVGLTGIAFVPAYHIKLEDPETLFIVMSQVLFHPLVGGFLLAAILAAIMSTISSQLLVTSSSLTEDFYKLIRGEEKAKTHQKEFVMIGRLSVLVVAIVAIAIAWNPNDTILNLVGNAWAGFGASFSPLVLFALYWKGLTRAGAVSGMVSGALVVIVWIAWIKPLAHINEIFGLYEIIPGFIVSVIVTYVVSKLTKKPGAFVETDLNKVRDIVREK
ncbi:sodium/solute symporter [Staphylococcus aureus]|nr:sodium/solute symporter [Staphylococcus aureus]MBH4679151.1 sodium/solute symporter [Staphylococcus aureus]